MKEAATRVTRVVFFLLLSAAFVFSSPCNAAQEEATGKKQVLVLNSYHKGLSWTDNVVKGIESVLGGIKGLELSLEYMDTKKHHDSRYFRKLYELYKLKYGIDPPGVVIVSDNDALDFIREYHDRLFPAIPVVFCGINDYRDSMLEGHKLFTGVVEETDVKETIVTALKLHPSARRITVVGDKSSAALAMQQEVLSAVPYFKDSVQFAFIEDFDTEELRQQVRELPADSIILMTVVNEDRKGNFFSYEESLALVYREAKVPIYSLWDFYIGKGITGGMLTSGKEQGRAAAELAVRILQGEAAGRIPVVRKSPNRYMFDYRELARFGIEQSKLPLGSEIVNEPDTHFFRLRTVMAVSAAVISLLLLAVVALAVRASFRKRIERALRKTEEKYRDFYENAPDMYHSVNKDGIIIDCNETEARMLGYRKNEIIGRPIADFFTEETKKVYEREFPTLKEKRVHLNLEREFVRRDGSTFTASLNIFIEVDEDGELVRTKAIARDLTERRRIEELKRSQDDLRNLSAYLDAAREEERKNIAREIHDELGISLTTLKLGLSWLKSYLLDGKNPPDIALLVARTQAMSEDIKGTIQAVQRISSELRPGVLDNLGLSAAVEWQAGEFRERTGLECETFIDEDITLDQNRSIAVYRIFQETLTNIMRYSEASRVEIALNRRDGMLMLEVRDNGRGITEEQIRDPKSFGLIGMRERAHFLGGRVNIMGVPDGGTTVTVTIPVDGGGARNDEPQRHRGTEKDG